ncbi:MAG TPA: hypothetical protein VFQ68_42555, partial [Streptosporangiaceae bacterium]|nr:hypothetical protein [Streptosporangiaceae bacterium]
DAKSYLHRSGRTARAGRDGCVVTLTTPRLVATVVRMQQNAGVEVLHHDLRSAPRPMTADALAEAGHPGPVRTSDASDASHPHRSGPRKPYRGQTRRPAGKSYAGRPQRRGKRPVG